MKKLMGMLAVVAFATSMANAELLKNFKYNGSVEVNMRDVNNADFNKKTFDESNNTLSRVMIGANFDLNEDVNAQVTAVKNARNYGNAKQTVAGGTIDSFNFEEAYLNLKGVFGADHKVGRQYYGNAGDMIVYYGPLMMPYVNALTVNAIDGYTGWWKQDKWAVNAILAKQGKATSVPLGTDQDLRGIVGSYDWRKEAKIGAYYYQGMTEKNALNSPKDILNVMGLKVNGVCPVTGIEYTGEYAMNTGRNNDNIVASGVAGANTDNKYSGSAYKLNLKYAHEFMGKWDFSGEYAAGTGDKNLTDKKVKAFSGINSDYRPGLVWAAERGNVGLGNLTTWNLGASWTPEKVNRLTAGAKYYHFAMTEKSGGNDKIGNELDLCATWKHSENVSIMGSYGSFAPEKKYAQAIFGATAKKDAETRMGLDLMVKF
ncbi:MAG: alginate export family protein [Elusimicrobiales bacterium]|jgi:hypothetical protein